MNQDKNSLKLTWQCDRDYGKRNQAEHAIGRYKRILGNRLHLREFERQRQEAIIGCSILVQQCQSS